jgi:non-ribosomal peptide synthetase component E (peptide arylation enzyme)
MPRFNDIIADMLAATLSTMACFWIITSMVVVVLLWQRPTSLVGWVTYFSTAVFQASALPVLAFVSKKEGNIQQALLQETHDTVMGELDRLGDMMAEMAATHAEVHEMMSQVHVRVVGAGEVDVEVSEEKEPDKSVNELNAAVKGFLDGKGFNADLIEGCIQRG